MKRAVNKMVSDKRVVQKVYVERDHKLWLNEKANAKGVSVSKFVLDLIKIEMSKDIRLDLSGSQNV